MPEKTRSLVCGSCSVAVMSVSKTIRKDLPAGGLRTSGRGVSARYRSGCHHQELCGFDCTARRIAGSRLEAMAVTGAPELLIVMGAAATQEQVDDVVARLEEAGCAALVTPGREATVIGAIGERELLAALPLEGYAGVEQVLPILKPYKLVSRELSPDSTVIQARGRRIGDGYFGFIAGPCSVESREQTLETARAVAAEGVTMLRGGAFKPRTSPYAFQGLGDEALEILKEAR